MADLKTAAASQLPLEALEESIPQTLANSSAVLQAPMETNMSSLADPAMEIPAAAQTDLPADSVALLEAAGDALQTTSTPDMLQAASEQDQAAQAFISEDADTITGASSSPNADKGGQDAEAITPANSTADSSMQLPEASPAPISKQQGGMPGNSGPDAAELGQGPANRVSEPLAGPSEGTGTEPANAAMNTRQPQLDPLEATIDGAVPKHDSEVPDAAGQQPSRAPATAEHLRPSSEQTTVEEPEGPPQSGPEAQAKSESAVAPGAPPEPMSEQAPGMPTRQGVPALRMEPQGISSLQASGMSDQQASGIAGMPATEIEQVRTSPGSLVMFASCRICLAALLGDYGCMEHETRREEEGAIAIRIVGARMLDEHGKDLHLAHQAYASRAGLVCSETKTYSRST